MFISRINFLFFSLTNLVFTEENTYWCGFKNNHKTHIKSKQNMALKALRKTVCTWKPSDAMLNTACFVVWCDNMDASVQFSHSVMSNSLRSHELQHARTPCPSPTPRIYPNPMSTESMMLSNHLILCLPFSSCPQSFPASWSFQMNQLFILGGQSIGVSGSTSVLAMNT